MGLAGLACAMEFVIPGCKPEPKPRLCSSKVHLTYAALYEDELDFKDILEAAKAWGASRGGLLEYAIGREQHSQPADPQRKWHFHVYLAFGKKVDVQDRLRTTVFDFAGNQRRILHPEVQGIGGLPGDRERVIRYDIKDGDYVSELHTPLMEDAKRDAEAEEATEEDGDEEAAEKPPGWCSLLNNASNVRDGMLLLSEKFPKVYYSMGSRIEPMLSKRVGARRAQHARTTHTSVLRASDCQPAC